MTGYLIFMINLPKFCAFSLSKVNAFWKFGVDFWKFGVLKNERNEAKMAKSEAKKVGKVAQNHHKCAIFGPFVTSFLAHRPSKLVRNAHFSLQNAPEFWTFYPSEFVDILNTHLDKQHLLFNNELRRMERMERMARIIRIALIATRSNSSNSLNSLFI